MPVLKIWALPQEDSKKIANAISKTSVAIAEEYRCDPKQVWVIWNEIRPGHYVEGREGAVLQPQGTHPPVGELLCFEGSSSEEIERVLLVAAKTLSEELEIPGNVFIDYREAKSGKVIAGDGLVRK